MCAQRTCGTIHGKPVTINKRHMRLHKVVMPFVEEAAQLASTQDITTDHKGFASVTVSFDRVIGKTDCVETLPTDNVVYAVRQGRDRHMRFVHGRAGTETSSLTLIVVSLGESWKLISAWFGGAATKEPQDPSMTEQERAEAYSFWNRHALIWGAQPVYNHTVTEECPWPKLGETA